MPDTTTTSTIVTADGEPAMPGTRPDPAVTRRPPAWPGLLLTQIRYQLKLSMRSSRSITSAILLPVLILIALRSSNGAGVGPDGDRVLVAGALVYGAVSMAYLSHAIWLVNAREKGVLKRFRGSPLPAWIYLAGRMVATTVLAVIASSIALELAMDIVSLSFPWARLPLIPLTLLVGSIVWASLGTMMSGLIATPDSAWSTLVTTFLPLLFISGVFIPTSTEPWWLADIANWLPAEPFGDLVQRCLGGPLDGAARDLLVLAAWLVISAVAARWTFRWLPGTHRRRRATRKGAGKSAGKPAGTA